MLFLAWALTHAFLVLSTCTHSPTAEYFNVLLVRLSPKDTGSKIFCLIFSITVNGNIRKKVLSKDFLGKNYGYKLHSTMRPWLHVERWCYLIYFCLSLSLFSSGVSTHSKNGSGCLVFFLENSFLSSFMSYPTN